MNLLYIYKTIFKYIYIYIYKITPKDVCPIKLNNIFIWHIEEMMLIMDRLRDGLILKNHK